ncbi:hypothetical protein HDU91_003776 [Kappamyces sp. JEL0680]|nr:hypothetical protein HDU91_003776 [Kappamyces sp. JEL0680]
MNGFTALHWAYSRGHAHIVNLLLGRGADAALKDNQGRTPQELAKKSETPGFVPNYIAAPDLGKLWNVPMLESEPARASSLPETADYGADRRETVAASDTRAPSAAVQEEVAQEPVVRQEPGRHERVQIVVYQQYKSPANVKGAIFVGRQETLGELAAILRSEIDDMPEAFSVVRQFGDVEIPLNRLQSRQPIALHFSDQSSSLVYKF